MKTLLSTITFATLLPFTAALAETDCAPPAAQADSYVELLKLADEFHWQIDKMKIDDGCYELRVTDENSNILKVKIDPATLDIVEGKVKRWSDGTKPEKAK